ncbi:MAG TPA: DNA repair protein RadA [Bacteroidetes bacterium]|nr:DNA repair protein RadA [Bacteroidota bacterium]
MTAVREKKEKTVFVCQECGDESPRWSGKCQACGAWNSMVEEKRVPAAAKGARYQGFEKSSPMLLSDVQLQKQPRIRTKSSEFDRTLGGGIVPGSIVLLSGDPGIGKSTLLLQRMAEIAASGRKTIYISGEESVQQTKMRADRLKLKSDNLFIYSEIDLSAILEAVDVHKPEMLVIDSIQTIYNPEFESAPGSVSQVRECALRLMQLAKRNGIPVILVGHVTKEGAIAGPRILEHMVDTMLYLEGDRQYQYRILRTVKNRFGSTNELGVFEVREDGLQDVSNPSELFLSGNREGLCGLSVTCTIEGTRPILAEIQALTSQSGFGIPQRTATGIDQRRLSLLLAVLEKRAGLRIGSFDVFVKVAGGLRLDEPAADLATTLAIASSFRDRPLRTKAVAIGEVGLGGDIRSVSQIERRILEAKRLGFEQVVLPETSKSSIQKNIHIDLIGVKTVRDALEAVMK